FAATRTVAARAGLRVPEPEAFAEAGTDFARLGTALAADPTLAPVIAPYGLGSRRWRELFARAAEESGGALAAADPLVVASEAEREFGRLDAVPVPEMPDLPATTAGAAAAAQPAVRAEPRWTLRLVPAGLAPAVLGLSFEHGPHASLPEMLMLQLTRLVAGEPLVDSRSFTWLAGTLAEGRLAARHVYDSAERAVRINCRETGNQGPHLGARPPVG
ncbi:MAG: hypothetical protein QM606_08235, partial [Leucobacter sp.]